MKKLTKQELINKGYISGMTVRELKEELLKYSDDLIVMVGDERMIAVKAYTDILVLDPLIPEENYEYREFLCIT